MPIPTVPSPRTWAAGDLILTPRLRADASDAVAFLASRPFVSLQTANTLSYPSGSGFQTGLEIELTDPWSMHNTSSGVNAQVWCQVPGWYLCRFNPCWAYTTTTQAQFLGGIQAQTGGVTGSTVWGASMLSGSGHQPVPQCWDLIEQTVTGPVGGSGDWITFIVYQATGSNQTLSQVSTELTSVSVRWVCATSGSQPLPVPPLTAVPSPITSAWLNANLRDTINFLIYPPACKAIYSAGSSTLASTTFPAGSVVPLNSVTFDNYSGFTTGASAKYTAPVAGIYFCHGSVNLASSGSSTSYSAGFAVNGGTTQWGDVVRKTSDSTGGGMTVTKRLRLNAGDTVQLIAHQGSGSAIAYNTTAANQTRFIICWDGA